MVKQGFGCLRGCQMREANVQTGEQTKVTANKLRNCLFNQCLKTQIKFISNVKGRVFVWPTINLLIYNNLLLIDV